MPIQAILFDLDGLMVDSEPLAKQAWRRLLARYGHSLDQATVDDLFGLRSADSARLVQERFSLPLSAEGVAAEKREILWSLLRDGALRAMPGLFDLLRAVDARGLVRAVATSSGRDWASFALRVIGAEHGFAAVITSDGVRNGKPAPDIYLAAARALSLQPEACLALEDSPPGVQAAKAAGMRCVAVPNEMTAGMDLSGADWIVPSLAAVAEQLDRLVAR
jgi:HAD superfamily hydrolase (TIGR01509 family)